MTATTSPRWSWEATRPPRAAEWCGNASHPFLSSVRFTSHSGCSPGDRPRSRAS